MKPSETEQYKNLKAQANRFFQDHLIKDLRDRLSKDPGSRVAFITVTFDKQRFQGKLRGYFGPARTKAIEDMAPDMFDTFRGFYIQMCRSCVNNFNRPSRHHALPEVVAFVDDKDGSDSPYPHIHAMIFLPSEMAEDFKEWHFKGLHKKTWKALQPNGTIEITAADSSESELTHKTVYCSKFWFSEFKRMEGSGGEGLMNFYPDNKPDHLLSEQDPKNNN